MSHCSSQPCVPKAEWEQAWEGSGAEDGKGGISVFWSCCDGQWWPVPAGARGLQCNAMCCGPLAPAGTGTQEGAERCVRVWEYEGGCRGVVQEGAVCYRRVQEDAGGCRALQEGV